MKTHAVRSGARFGARLALFCSAASVLVAPAFAQETTSAAAEAPAGDADIVVTALKRATSIQDTPLAISAVGAATLANQNITDSTQLTRVTPNLRIEENNGGSRITIRNLRASGEALVGLYYDETPLSGTGGVSNDAGANSPSVRLFDVERAEVLRGPQGTLYGASSMAGTMRIIFNKPNLVDFEGALNGQVTTTDSASGTGQILDAMANVPIIADKLAVRAVGYYNFAPGYVNNSILGLKDINDSRGYGGRLLVRARPIENLTIDGMAVYQNSRGDSGAWNNTLYRLTGNKFDQTLTIRQPRSDAMQLYSGTLNWDFGFATLTAVASYSKRDIEYNFDYTPYFRRYFTGTYTGDPARIPGYAAFASDCNAGRVTGLPGCTGTDYQNFVTSWGDLTAYQPQTNKTSTQEIRLASDANALKWTIGFYHSDRKNFTRSLLNTVDPITGAQSYPNGYVLPYGLGSKTHLDRTIDDSLKQIAGFAELTYDITDALSVTGGIRYFEYKKVTGAEVIIPNYVAGNTITPYSEMKGKENGTLLKFGASYKITPDVMIFASASQGYRPGGVNQTLGLPSYAATYESDKLWDYELGVKSSWFDRKLIVNADVFQMDWTGMQVSASYQGAFGFLTNSAAKARIRGIELESTVMPLDGLTLRASGSYTTAKLQDDINLPSSLNVCQNTSPPYVGCVVFRGLGKKGNTLPYTSKWTLQGQADYTRPVGGDLAAMGHADVSYRSGFWTIYDPSAAGVIPDNDHLAGYATVNLRIGLEKEDGRWGVYAFVNNVFNKLAILSKSSSATSSTIAKTIVNGQSYDTQNISTIEPRVMGLSFRSKF
ncbi:TonB-dependent receptor [Novosphingobium album (ex Liu et al. 2023)]|uniref:TonB-dependent receptor n=1 Tax=Novosphingobium album (ex Liu et al. 2023) TaxID=3031130 RepID=A0ABT5WMB8_9SPHN|nr:TonB-dependent receptor [Novosphingobium album (ex Liu et al. 2023)]MDE8651182.1 TonB-dependent receptor [Novosphingobium album (ex Liu et al. 2023)]